MSGFDRIAYCYDFLAWIVFGKSIVEAQEHFLSRIQKDNRVLILGGGTGWILELIFKETNPGVIWYVDNSLKMIEKSKTRDVDFSKIHFVHGTVEAIPPDLKVDVVITNFFLDMFSNSELPKLIENIKAKVSPQGIWICTDFVETGKWRHKLLLRSMYLFFKTVVHLKNNSMPDWEGNLRAEGFTPFEVKSYWNGFIKSAVFKGSI